MVESNDEHAVEIRLSNAQALVLFEFLARETEGGKDCLTLTHPAEERVLWAIEGQLEKRLVEIFQPDYQDLVHAARASLVAER